MLFTSASFLLLHLLTVALRWVVPAPLVRPLLMVSSAVFYLSWGPRYGLLFLSMALVAWGGGWLLPRVRRPGWVLAACVTVLLGAIGYFKYADLALDQWEGFTALLGAPAPDRTLAVVLPLGISFYTFQAVSYLVDVSRGERPEPSLWKFVLFLAFYPQLIAGPIVRPSELLPQLHAPRRFSPALFSDGVFLFLIGFLKKLVFADRLGDWSDVIFANPGQHSTWEVWLGVLAYTGQIYCDFCGYTDIAHGSANMLGFTLPANFRLPYVSTTLTEFWRRWHLTLSRWLRDYLYLPLGGNRGGRWRQYRNLFLTMLLGGLWHGASWTFVFWGGLHGAGLAVHKAWAGWADTRPGLVAVRRSVPFHLLSWLGTFLFVMVGWVYFRSPTFERAHQVLGRMFSTPAEALSLQSQQVSTTAALLVALGLGHVISALEVPHRFHRALVAPARGAVWLALVLACYLWADPRDQFIYFQF